MDRTDFGYDAPCPEPNDAYHGNFREEIVPLVTSKRGTLVDIGGGIGITAAYLKHMGKADRAGVVDLITAPKEVGQTLDFAFIGNIEDPAFLGDVIEKEGPFTTILLLDVLEHLVDPWSAISRLHLGLVPGGEIIASIPNVRHYSALAPLLFRNEWKLQNSGVLDRTHLRFFVKNSMVELLTCSGLKLEEIRPNPSQERRAKWLRRLSFGLLNSFTNIQYLIRVRRPESENPSFD